MVDERVLAALPAYEITSELGRGAYGVVLAGRHRQLGRLVAIKQLPRAFGADPAVRARFIAEARVLATLDHPHIVAIYDFVDYDGLCLLVMERLTGGTVWSRFHAGGFTPDVSCAILLAVCAGLHHAHQHGVLHRDIKPENLMFSGEGTLKVTDLGIAKVVGGSSTLATRAGEVLGTPAYIAPEQARGADLTPATDVYQAGTLLYELLAGRLPFPADSDPATILYRHVHEVPPPLLEAAHHVPAELAAVTDRAISTLPADRYQSAEELGVAIASCAARTWGRGWLARTNVPVSASGPVLAAALGEIQPVPKVTVPTAVETGPARGEPREPVPGDYVPVQLAHPELRDHATGGDDAPAGTPEPVSVDEHVEEPAVADVPVPADVSDATRARTSDAPSVADPRAPERAADRDRAHDQPDSTRARRPRQRALVAAIAAAIVVLAGVAAIAWTLTRGGGSHPERAARSTPAAPVNAAPTAWRALPDAPTARQQVASTVYQGRVWVLGGLTNGAATTKVEAFDPAIENWTAGPDLPLPLHHEIAVDYHGEIVVMGGWVPDGPTLDATTSDRVFALRGGSWVELPHMNHARAAGAAAVVDDRIVVTGGQANHLLVPQTEVFDGTRWTDVAPMPTPRDHLAAASDGRYLYAVGGRALSADKNFAALERYDPSTNQWTELPPMPTARGGLGAAVVGNRLVTLGGEAPTSVYGTVEVFDLTTGTWSKLTPMRTPRHGLAVLSVGTTLYAFDGAGAPGHVDSLATAESVDLRAFPNASPWRALPDAPIARQQVASTTFQGTLWIFGGLVGDGTTSTAKALGYDPTISTWEAGPDLPLALNHATAVVDRGEIVVIGGWVPSGSSTDAIVSDRVFALRGGSWVELPHLNHARAAGAAAVVGDRVVVTGGQANHRLVRETEVFDGTRWRDVAPMPTPRDHLAAASDGRYVYAVGGRMLSSDKNSGAVERYDPASDTWTKLPSMPTPRGDLGAVLVGHRLVTLGGESPTSVYGNVEALDLTTRTWSALPPMRTPRHGMAVLAVGDNVYAIGGTATPGHVASLTTAEAFTLG
ncbi:MAG TPA: kelch repeat-containing protein [Acidimicrobiia bacterium]|nr:kelch repeat-containing protein [Acidimicrobiia bacterium]